jgi:hypothetical protein
VSENSWTSDNTTTWIGHINRQVEIPRRKSALILNLGVQNSATIHGYHTVTDFSDTHCCMNYEFPTHTFLHQLIHLQELRKRDHALWQSNIAATSRFCR